MKELATRIIFNTKGSAFQKLELKQSQVLTGEKAGIGFVAGQFGQIDLEKKYEIVGRDIRLVPGQS